MFKKYFLDYDINEDIYFFLFQVRNRFIDAINFIIFTSYSGQFNVS
jgi:hypothetical protein